MTRLLPVGLAIFALGGGADLLHHVAPTVLPYGSAAHALTLAGMVLTMLGVLTKQLRRNQHAVR